MANIHSLTISRGGEFKLEQTNDTSPKAASSEDRQMTYKDAQPDKISYAGVGECVLRVAKRFGMSFDLHVREKCEESTDRVWEDASLHVGAAKHIVSTWLDNHRKAVEEMDGVPLHQFDGGQMHGTVRVDYTTDKDGNILALDLKSDKSGFKAHVEDSTMFTYLWGRKTNVASK